MRRATPGPRVGAVAQARLRRKRSIARVTAAGVAASSPRLSPTPATPTAAPGSDSGIQPRGRSHRATPRNGPCCRETSRPSSRRRPRAAAVSRSYGDVSSSSATIKPSVAAVGSPGGGRRVTTACRTRRDCRRHQSTAPRASTVAEGDDRPGLSAIASIRHEGHQNFVGRPPWLGRLASGAIAMSTSWTSVPSGPSSADTVQPVQVGLAERDPAAIGRPRRQVAVGGPVRDRCDAASIARCNVSGGASHHLGRRRRSAARRATRRRRARSWEPPGAPGRRRPRAAIRPRERPEATGPRARRVSRVQGMRRASPSSKNEGRARIGHLVSDEQIHRSATHTPAVPPWKATSPSTDGPSSELILGLAPPIVIANATSAIRSPTSSRATPVRPSARVSILATDPGTHRPGKVQPGR